MLDLSKISGIQPYSDDWFKNRLGKFTGSEMCNLMGYADKELTTLPKGSLTYLRNKVAEVLTGQPSTRNITTPEILHGIDTEPKALAHFTEVTGWKLVINKHIIYDERCTVTPDALAITREAVYVKQQKDGSNERDVSPVECKCPSVFAKHMEFLECNTAMDLKKVNSDYYWQVQFQILACGATEGHFISFNPLFPEKTRMAHIVLKAIDKEVAADTKALKTRIELAKQEFNKILLKFQ